MQIIVPVCHVLILLLSPENFSGRLTSPVSSLLQRPVEGDGAGIGAIIDAAAAIPALIRVQDYGWLSFLRIRNINVDLADINAMVAAVAYS